MKSYKRERNKNTKTVVSEICSPPGVTKMLNQLPSHELLPSFAMDLATTDEDGKAWDFDKKQMRDRARALIEEQYPYLLIGFPMRTAFCKWHDLNKMRYGPGKYRREYIRAMIHFRFAGGLYKQQIDAGRYLLHEHPYSAKSWNEMCIQNIWRHNAVDRVIADQCRFGQRCSKNFPVKRPTGSLTNLEQMMMMMMMALLSVEVLSPMSNRDPA